MRWLMIVFLVSLVVLLIASAGLAHHIWQVHRRRSKVSSTAGRTDDADGIREDVP